MRRAFLPVARRDDEYWQATHENEQRGEREKRPADIQIFSWDRTSYTLEIFEWFEAGVALVGRFAGCRAKFTDQCRRRFIATGTSNRFHAGKHGGFARIGYGRRNSVFT